MVLFYIHICRILFRKLGLNCFSFFIFFIWLDLDLEFRLLLLLLLFLWCLFFIILLLLGPVLYFYLYSAYTHSCLRAHDHELQTSCSFYCHDLYRLWTFSTHLLLVVYTIRWAFLNHICLLLYHTQLEHYWTCIKLFLTLLLGIHKLSNLELRYKYDEIEVHHKCASFDFPDSTFYFVGLPIYTVFSFNIRLNWVR